MKAPRIRLLVALTGVCVVLIPWIVLLALTLPSSYTARRWDWTWIGFDLALLGCLVMTAWSAYRQRLAVVFWAVVTGALLVCDAWFDVMTAADSALVVSILEAVFVELPLTAVLFYAARRVMLMAAGRAHHHLSKVPVTDQEP